MAPTSFAKNLRKRSTEAEIHLWKFLRTKQFLGLKFRRQHPLGKYIADFCCLERNIVIELDGGQHAWEGNDRHRDEWLAAEGYLVLRFWNHEVLMDVEAVLERIADACRQAPSPWPPPLKGGGTLSEAAIEARLELTVVERTEAPTA